MSHFVLVASLVVAVAACRARDDAVPRSMHTATSKPEQAAAGMRCTLRISAKGLYVDGAPESRAAALAACKRAAGAMVVLEDDAPAGEWRALRAALRRAGVPILVRGSVGDTECLDNPLAAGCN